MAVDPDFSLQDLLRCNLCETQVPSLHYKACHKQLCKVCYEKHLLKESKEHRLHDSCIFRIVSCFNEENILTYDKNNILTLYSPQGKPMIAIPTKSGNWQMDIMMTWNGDLVYVDSTDRTVYLVNNTDNIEPVFTLPGWKPQSVSGSSIGGLLIVLDSDDDNHAKVIHFCGYEVIQTIQFDDDSFPLYLSGSIKYISENRNLDICVSDCVAGAVVVVNQTGKFRFRYKGIYSENSCRPFKPFGITTDSQGWILAFDWYNQRVHILDKDGLLLCYIVCDFFDPYGVCVADKGDLFVSRYYGGKVMKFWCICNQTV